MRTDIMMSLALIGGFLGGSIILYDADTTSRSEMFIQTPGFIVWFLLMTIQAAFFSVVIAPLSNSIQQFEKYFINHKLEIGISSLIFSILFSLPSGVPRSIYLSGESWPLDHHSIKVVIISIAAYLTALVAVIGMQLINVGFRTISSNEIIMNEAIHRYVELQHHLQKYVAILGGMIGLAILSTGA